MQDEPYKFTVIGKDLQDVSLSTADFLVHDGQMTFISNDKEGVLRLVDFDPAGMSPHDRDGVKTAYGQTLTRSMENVWCFVQSTMAVRLSWQVRLLHAVRRPKRRWLLSPRSYMVSPTISLSRH